MTPFYEKLNELNDEALLCDEAPTAEFSAAECERIYQFLLGLQQAKLAANHELCPGFDDESSADESNVEQSQLVKLYV